MIVFIIAGVGDHTKYIKDRTKKWNDRYDLQPVVLKFGWKGDYDANYATIKGTIEKIAGSEEIAVIGISAGGSAAIRLASELSNAKKVVTICARTSKGGFMLFSLASFPAYWESVDMLGDVQCDVPVMIIKPLFDEIVSTNHMDYAGAKVLRVPYVLHIPSLLRVLRARSDDIAKFLNSVSR